MRRDAVLFEDGPVEGVVVLVVQRAEKDAEQLSQIHIVGRLLETQAAAVVEIHGELARTAFAEHLQGRGHLLLADPLVLLLLVDSLSEEARLVGIRYTIIRNN